REDLRGVLGVRDQLLERAPRAARVQGWADTSARSGGPGRERAARTEGPSGASRFCDRRCASSACGEQSVHRGLLGSPTDKTVCVLADKLVNKFRTRDAPAP